MKKFSLFTLLLATVLALQAQKVKYKDIFPDLEARKFNKVEPLLKSFLANEKNAEHPNANYQMGLITEAHFLLQDIVSDTTALFRFGDEALNFYRKSITLITEKELKKHDQYYQGFNRRDLRTGEFGIKLSDVHLEIEKKIESLENRISAVKSFHKNVLELTAIESELLEEFSTLITSANSYNDYLMKADLEAISALGDVQAKFKAFDDKANATLKVGKDLGAEDYYKEIEYLPINDFSTLTAKFQESNSIISTYQFSDWATTTKAKLNSEVFVMKNKLEEFDLSLRKATNLIKSGSRTEYPQRIEGSLERSLVKYDPQGLPRQILKARILENSIRTMSDTSMNSVLLDSSVIAMQLEMADSAIRGIEELKTLLAFDVDEVNKAHMYYEDYITSVGGMGGLLKYVRENRTWISQQDTTWRNRLDFWDVRNNWGTTETDTIPLHVVDTSYHGTYVTKGYLDLPENEIVSWGFKRDSLIGFIARFGAARELIWESRFETELLYVDVHFPFESDTLSADAEQLAFYIYKDLAAGQSNINVVNVSMDGEINWSANTQSSRKPEYTTYSHEIQETTIFLYPQEQYPLTNGELGYLIINRDGEVR